MTASRKLHRLPAAAIALTLAACAGSAAVYEYLPTERALRYEFSGSVASEIATPGGAQAIESEPEATVVVSMGARGGAGTEFSATFESFRASPAGPGLDMTGVTFSGVVAADGTVEITVTPEIALEGLTSDDLSNIVTSLFAPLPPGGTATSESWPHKVEGPVGAGMQGSTSYEGVARFTGDTIWNGIPAQIIFSEGKWTMTGKGQPAGAPAEIDMALTGTSSTVYVWDPARGVLLGAESVSEGDGTVEAMGFEMPMTNAGATTITLKMPDAMTTGGGDS